jgi:hypothetical protein
MSISEQELWPYFTQDNDFEYMKVEFPPGMWEEYVVARDAFLKLNAKIQQFLDEEEG